MASAQQPNFFALLDADAATLETEAREKPRRKARLKAKAAQAEAGTRPVVAYDAQQEAWACELERSGRYRILRQLQFRPVVARDPLPDEKVAVIVDVETTGLDHTKDEVIELGMVAVTYKDDGSFGDVIATFSELREPGIPISAESARITGITPEMVAGKALDLDAVTRFIEPASLVIAHNARFDRPFCEKLARGFDVKAWACSASEIAWANFGFEGVKLGYLVGQSGWFHNGHRAVDDCHALLEVLGAPLKDTDGPAFARLLASARSARYRIWAEYSPFDMKDVLKARGYRWNDGSDGRPKSWWVETSEEALEAELQFLRSDIYQRDADPRVDRITAFERFKAAR